MLVTGEPAQIDAIVRLAEATALVRDLVNTPAGDLGPAELEQAVRDVASESGAQVRVTAGDELAEGYPLIAAVGGAATAERAPRLIELEWGKPERSADRDRRQGRVLRQRRARPQDGGRHAADEEGHGRRGARAGAGPADHRPNGCRCGSIC